LELGEILMNFVGWVAGKFWQSNSRGKHDGQLWQVLGLYRLLENRVTVGLYRAAIML